MAISRTNANGKTTVTFSYVADTQRMSDTLADAAKYLFDKTPKGEGWKDVELAEDLTVAQMGLIVDAYLQRVIKDCAQAYYLGQQSKAAKETAETNILTRHI